MQSLIRIFIVKGLVASRSAPAGFQTLLFNIDSVGLVHPEFFQVTGKRGRDTRATLPRLIPNNSIKRLKVLVAR